MVISLWTINPFRLGGCQHLLFSAKFMFLKYEFVLAANYTVSDRDIIF